MFTKDLYLAGGSFHGLQEVFSRIYGVVDTQAGYANSRIEAPTKEPGRRWERRGCGVREGHVQSEENRHRYAP